MPEPIIQPFSCPTDKCKSWVNEVNGASATVAKKYQDTFDRMDHGDLVAKWTDEKKLAFVDLWAAFLQQHRNPWNEKKGKLLEECDSVFPASCNLAIIESSTALDQVKYFDEKLATFTGEKPVIVVPENKPDKNANKPWFGVEIDWKGMLFIALVGAGGYYLLTRK